MTLQYQTPNTSPDEGYLKALSICYYIMAGISALGGLCMGGYMGFISMIIKGSAPPGAMPPQAAMMTMFFVIAVVYVVLFVGFGVCLFFAARSIARRTGYIFIMVIAGIACLQIPFGTTLGVFTFVLLARPTTRVLFGRQP